MKTILITIWIYILFVFNPLHAGPINEKRLYEHVVIPEWKINLAQLQDVPVNDIYLYSFSSTTEEWKLMPFQIDERTKGPDNNWHYFIPREWGDVDTIKIKEHDGLFNSHDEIIFMVRDLGDKAPPKSWIGDDESRTRPKIEIAVEDPNNQEILGYCYIYQSSTISDQIPRPYNFEYFESSDSVSTLCYSAGINANGVIEDIVIKKPGGNGEDIFDTQKIRGSFIFSHFIQVDLSLNEESFYFLEDVYHNSSKAVVRFLRKANMGLSIAAGLFDAKIPVTTKFYPYGGTISGGDRLTEEDLQKWLPLGTNIIMKDLRQSWDFNQNAVGMTFINKYNGKIKIDGIPDEVNQQIDILPENPFPISVWNLTTGLQGTMFSLTQFKESSWGNVRLYYFDSEVGSPLPDSASFSNLEDTGDNKSFGDQGIFFQAFGQSGISLELDFTAFFLPEQNLTASDGEELAVVAENPVAVRAALSTAVTSPAGSAIAPDRFALEQNFPNPFNRETMISYSLPEPGEAILQIYTTSGALVRTLDSAWQPAGTHRCRWDGCDDRGAEVASGLYLYRLSARGYMHTRKLLLIK